ncbi:MAG: S8 family serine peptidase [Cytophagaceae bacterium]|jgi:subtilisin family serine protease|nr:S8 family serine peptidase [Cytophagaceae bacterium]
MNTDDNFGGFVILEVKDTNDIVLSNAIESFKSRSSIISATPLFLYNDVLEGLTDEFAVKLKPTVSYSQLQELAKQNNCTVKEENKFVKNQFMISVSKNANLNAMEMSRLFFESGLFEFSEPNFIFFNIFNSNDTYFPDQWGLKNTGQNGGTAGMDIKAEQAWTISLGTNIKVAVIDEGVDLTHPDLHANLLQGYDAPSGNSGGAPIYSSEKHGTACAGIIGAIKDNGIGIAGVSPNSKIIPVHVTFGSYSGQVTSDDWLADAINWAWQNGADVISNSWCGGSPYQPMTNAINAAVNQGRSGKGCVVVFSSGNNYASTVNYPTRLPNVIAVGSITSKGQRAAYSNYGINLDIVAPGGNSDIYTTDRQEVSGYNTSSGIAGNYYCCFDGTSAACPHVAGVAALILSANPDLFASQVRNIIGNTAQKIRTDLYTYSTISGHPNGTWNNQVGYGLVDAYAAVQAACPTLVNFTNRTVTTNTTVTSCGDINVENVTVKNGAKLTLDAPGEVNIGNNFEVEENAEFEIIEN